MASIFRLPRQIALTSAGVPIPGCKANIYQTGTTTPVTIYTDVALTIPGANPIVADASGVFPVRWLDDSVVLKLVLTTSADVLIYQEDPFEDPALTQAQIGSILYPRTAAEIAAGVTPTNYAYEPGQRPRYASLADAVAVCASHPLWLYSDETITAHITIPDGGKIYGIGRPQITNSTAGDHVFDAVSKSRITIQFVRFKGANSSTTPSNGFGGYSAANTGLVTLAVCTDVNVDHCEFDTFYNGVATLECARANVLLNRVRHFLSFGVVASRSSYSHFDYNTITECDQTGGVVAYGIIATGDDAGGKPQKSCTINGNLIDGIDAWDAIMSHDCDGLVIANNDIRNVRQGIDIGHLVSTNVVKNVVIANNSIVATTTDTWSGAGAQMGGIIAEGFDATHRILGLTITGNQVAGFFNITGAVAGGSPSHIVVTYADDAAVTGNSVSGGGNLPTNSAGVYVGGTTNRLAITGNTLQGQMALGGIRFASATVDVVAISGNTIKQTSTGNEGIAITGSTISGLALGANVTNSSLPWSVGTSTITLAGMDLEGTATYDPPNLADGAGTTTTVTVTGAALGDYAIASFGGDLAGITVTAYVSSADTVSVRFQNESGGALDLGSSTLRARVTRKIN